MWPRNARLEVKDVERVRANVVYKSARFVREKT